MGTNCHYVQFHNSFLYIKVGVPTLTVHQNKFAKGGLSKPNRLWAPATKPYPPADHDTIIPLRNANNGLDGRRQRQRQRKRRQHTQPSTSKGAYVPVASVTRPAGQNKESGGFPSPKHQPQQQKSSSISPSSRDRHPLLHQRLGPPRTASLRTTRPIKWVLIFSHASRGFSSSHARVADRHRLRSSTITNRALPSRFPGSDIVTQCTTGMLHAASFSSMHDKLTAVDNNNSNGEWRPRRFSSTAGTIQNSANHATTIIQGSNIHNCDIYTTKTTTKPSSKAATNSTMTTTKPPMAATTNPTLATTTAPTSSILLGSSTNQQISHGINLRHNNNPLQQAEGIGLWSNRVV